MNTRDHYTPSPGREASGVVTAPKAGRPLLMFVFERRLSPAEHEAVRRAYDEAIDGRRPLAVEGPAKVYQLAACGRWEPLDPGPA